MLGGFTQGGGRGAGGSSHGNAKDVHRWPGGGLVSGQGMGVIEVKAGEGFRAAQEGSPTPLQQ